MKGFTGIFTVKRHEEGVFTGCIDICIMTGVNTGKKRENTYILL